MVGGVPEPAGQQAQAAPKGVGHRADVRRTAAERRQPVPGGGGHHLLPGHPRAHPGGTGGRVDPHLVHPTGADQHARPGGQGRTVPGRLHTDRQAVRGGELHREPYVLVVDGADHQGRGMWPEGLVADAFLVVAVVARSQDRAAYAPGEFARRRLVAPRGVGPGVRSHAVGSFRRADGGAVEDGGGIDGAAIRCSWS